MGRRMENLDPTLMARIEKECVGPFLRHMREEKDLLLRSISEQTRIRTYYLESIENGDFDKLPTGPVGLGFVRAFADAVGVDSNAVAANYKRETTGGVPLEELGLEPESRTLYSPVSRVNRFSSVATVAFVLVFLLAGGGVLWFMKGRTEQLVPVSSIVGRIKTAIAPVAEKTTRQNGVDEKANNKNGTGTEAKIVGNKEPVQERPPASAANLKKPVVSENEGKPSRAEEKPPLQASAPARQNPAVEETPPAQASPSPQIQESTSAQDSVRAQESSPAPQNPLVEQSAPAEEKVALNTAPARQAASQEQQSSAAPALPAPAASTSPTPAPASSKELPLTLKIFATEDTWLRIVVDEKNTEELLLLAGNEKDWKASEKFALTVGNVAGTQISLNGAEVALPKNNSNVLRDFVISKKYLN